MTNVLPPEYKKAVWRRERARFIFAFSVVALFCTLIACISLAPTFAVIILSGIDVSARESAASTSASGARIEETKTLIADLRPAFLSTTTPSEIVSRVLALKPAGLAIHGIEYAAGKEGQVTLVGAAENPQIIEAYRSLLAREARFKSVSVPVDALVGANTGQFTITVKGEW